MKFPPDFLFGTANADHQVEAHDPACEDVWDAWERCQGLTPRGRGTDFLQRYREDVAAAAEMGCHMFRFSVSWARVEPRDGSFDDAALARYRTIAECIRAHGMRVMLTLHHFVWPVWLERGCGGMLGDEFPDRFSRYAGRVAGETRGLIDYWITFNEPSQLTFGYIKPWWRTRYYMPPGLPRGSNVDAEAEAVGRLVPNLFRAHARARAAIRSHDPHARVGVNPLMTGFPGWLQALMDFDACHRRLGEALFKFTASGPLVSERSDVDVLIAGISGDAQTRYETSAPYHRTRRAVMVRADDPGIRAAADLAGRDVAVVGLEKKTPSPRWARDLPDTARPRLTVDYLEARAALAGGRVDAVYGDAFFLRPHTPHEGASFRLLPDRFGGDSYVAAVAPGHGRLLARVNEVVAAMRNEESGGDHAEPPRPVSLHELWEEPRTLPHGLGEGRDLRRLRKRGVLRVGLRADTPEDGVETRLARRIAADILGDENRLAIVRVRPDRRFRVLRSKSGWLNWAWRFWGTTSLIANANWWYLGMAGRLPRELCPPEAVGAQDFVGLDYYWGLPTRRLHRFRMLEDAAHGRFLQAPVWPEGLYQALRRMHRWFPGTDILVVENGSVAEASGIRRADYLKQHLRQVLRALEAGVPVKGYNCWSVTSNREWGHPFDPNTDFGLHFVDLDNDPSLTRHPTPDAASYRKIIRSREVGGE